MIFVGGLSIGDNMLKSSSQHRVMVDPEEMHD